jgi:SAM-dependent methyltransferase
MSISLSPESDGGARAGFANDSKPAPCQVCAAPDPVRFAEKDGLALYRCRDCALVYLDPMPSADALTALYDDAYAGATTGYFAKPKSKLRRARARMGRLVRHAPGGRFLDVGCNGGFMMEAARERGFEAHGVELDAVSLAYAREHFPENTYFHGRIEDYAPPAAFDAVVCSEVIEHVPDAYGFTAAIAALMKPGAVLYLTTPDIGHWRRPRDLARWDAFCPPAHCLYFSRPNLTRLLGRHGLEVFKTQFAWKPGIKLFARKTG